MNGDLYITSLLAGCVAHLPIFPTVRDLQGKQFHSCPWSPIPCLKTVTGNSSQCLTERSCAVVSEKIKSSWPHLLHGNPLGD